MLAQLLPARVASAETFGDAGDLLPEEQPYVEGVVASRRAAFTTARACARRALADLGLPPVAIPRGDEGQPVWPDGVAGSITHCDGYRAAAVARTEDVASVGIDAEPAGALRQGVLARIASPGEREHLEALAGTRPDVAWDRLLFSAKESVYKAWWPLTGRWLGFEDAELAFGADGSFTARLLVEDVPAERFHGRWATGRGLVVTAVAVPAQPD